MVEDGCDCTFVTYETPSLSTDLTSVGVYSAPNDDCYVSSVSDGSSGSSIVTQAMSPPSPIVDTPDVVAKCYTITKNCDNAG